MFRVDQRVVCVDDGPAFDGWVTPLVKNRIYTVSGFSDVDGRWGPGVYLYGIDNTPRKTVVDGIRFRMDGFCASRFRPVQEKKTDIGLLTALLNPANHKVLEDALA